VEEDMTADLWATLIPALAALALALAGYIKSRTAVARADAAHDLAGQAHAKASQAMAGLTGKQDKAEADPAAERLAAGGGL
jgi:hypothetical protein